VPENLTDGTARRWKKFADSLPVFSRFDTVLHKYGVGLRVRSEKWRSADSLLRTGRRCLLSQDSSHFVVMTVCRGQQINAWTRKWKFFASVNLTPTALSIALDHESTTKLWRNGDRWRVRHCEMALVNQTSASLQRLIDTTKTRRRRSAAETPDFDLSTGSVFAAVGGRCSSRTLD